MTRHPDASITSSPSRPVPTATTDSPSISTSASNASVAVTTRPPRMRRLIRETLRDLVHRPVATLGRRQTTALGGDRTALDAVGGVDDQVDHPLLRRVLGDLVDAGGAHPGPALADLTRHPLLDPDVRGRVVARRVAGQKDARELVEGVLAVGLRIGLVAVGQRQR